MPDRDGPRFRPGQARDQRERELSGMHCFIDAGSLTFKGDLQAGQQLPPVD
jgi:hypothetical protein